LAKARRDYVRKLHCPARHAEVRGLLRTIRHQISLQKTASRLSLVPKQHLKLPPEMEEIIVLTSHKSKFMLS